MIVREYRAICEKCNKIFGLFCSHPPTHKEGWLKGFICNKCQAIEEHLELSRYF